MDPVPEADDVAVMHKFEAGVGRRLAFPYCLKILQTATGTVFVIFCHRLLCRGAERKKRIVKIPERPWWKFTNTRGPSTAESCHSQAKQLSSAFFFFFFFFWGGGGGGGGGKKIRYRGPSLRSDAMKRERRASKGKYVLEAQALKEVRDDPRRSRSSPAILLHDGGGRKRKNLQAGPVTNEGGRCGSISGSFAGGRQVVVEASGFWPAFREVVAPESERLVMVHPQRVKAIASAKLKNDRVDSETLAHLSRCDLLPEAWKADGETQAWRQLVRLRITLVRQRTRRRTSCRRCCTRRGCASR